MASQRNIFLNAAFDIGAKICREAIWDHQRCNWIGPVSHSSPSAFHKLKSLGLDFYDGVPGIAFFLSYLYKNTDEPIIKKHAEGAIRQILSVKDRLPVKGKESFYCGITGLAYTLIHAGEQLDNTQWTEKGLHLLTELKDHGQENFGIDLINGPAGAIPALLYIHKKFPADFIKKMAENMGDFIIDISQKDSAGVSWETLKEKTNNLTGFAHGAAGMASALMELYNFTDKKKYLEIAEQAFRYENYWFDGKKKNWPDFRNFRREESNKNSQRTFTVAWCHGAPGIGLSRLRAYEITRNEKWKNDALYAIEATIESCTDYFSKETYNLSMCHGILGNNELFLNASIILKDKNYRVTAEKTAVYAIERFLLKGISLPCGLNQGQESPGFMLGTAGIGYHFLRLYNENTPSILIINPD